MSTAAAPTLASHVPAQRFALKSRRAWQIVWMGISLVVLGFGAMRRGLPPTVGWVTIACGAVVIVWFGQPAWRRAPALWFDHRGLFARVPGIGPVPWPGIERVRLVRTNGTSHFLVVDRTSEERARRPLSMLAVAIAKKPEASDLAIPLDHLAVAPEKVFAVVDLAHRHAVGQVSAVSPPEGPGARPRR